MTVSRIGRWLVPFAATVALAMLCVTTHGRAEYASQVARERGALLNGCLRLDYEVGPVRLTRLDGSVVRLDAPGDAGLTMVAVDAVQCSRCKADAKTWRHVAALGRERREPILFVVVGNADRARAVQEYGSLEEVDVAYHEDPSLFTRLGIVAVPYVVRLDSKGRVVYRDGLAQDSLRSMRGWMRGLAATDHKLLRTILRALATPLVRDGASEVCATFRPDEQVYVVRNHDGREAGFLVMFGIEPKTRGTTPLELAACFTKDGRLLSLMSVGEFLLFGSRTDISDDLAALRDCWNRHGGWPERSTEPWFRAAPRVGQLLMAAIEQTDQTLFGDVE